MPRKTSPNANLASIATKTGLSISTVSRALRDAAGIHPETRERVAKAAQEVGYVLPQDRQVDVNVRPHHIMALVQRMVPLSDQKYLTGMSRASVALNLAILTHYVSVEECEGVLDLKSQPTALRAGLVEGLVLIHRWPQEVAAALSQKWPTVSIVHDYPDTLIDHIGTDDRSGVLALMRHLHDGGHRQIGFFGFCRDMSWSCARFAAYVEALARLDLPYDPKNVVEITLQEALSASIFATSGWETKVMSRLKQGADAWLCASATTGHTLCRQFLTKGVRMPDDASLVSCHGASIGAPADLPMLTSTEHADEELGAAALRRLLHRFSHPTESHRSILIPSHLVLGETSRKIAAAL